MPQLLLGLALVTSACTKVEFARQELKLTHDEEADALNLDISYRGLIAGNSGFDVACAWLQGMLDKRPRFIVLGWPFEFDLEQIGDEWLLEHVSVQRAELALEEGPRMHMNQRLHLQSAQEALRRANAAISAQLVKEYGEADLEREATGWMDVKTLEMALAQARRGDPWISLGEGALHFHLPCSQAVFHAALMNIVDPPKMEEPGRALLRETLAQLGGVSYSAGRLDLSFPFAGQKGLRLSSTKDFSTRTDKEALALEFSGK
jgi:hypothetical protein